MRRDAMPPHLIYMVLFCLLRLTCCITADSGKVSTKCTKSSLPKTSVIKTHEGQPFNFSIEAFNAQCETSPCVGSRECDLSCGQCARYSGPPYFSFKFVNTRTSSVLRNVTCRISTSSTGTYPVSCIATNSLANNRTSYRIILSLVESTSAPVQLTELSATVVLLPGYVSLNHSTGSWIDGINVYKAGSKAKLYVQLKDAYNNKIYGTAIKEQKLIGRVTTVTNKEHAIYQTSFVAHVEAGYQLFEYETTRTGHYLLYVGDPEGHEISHSPFEFNITAGDLSVPSCTADWVDGNNTFKAGEEASLLVLMKDAYNNTLSLENGWSGFFEFSMTALNVEIANVSVSSQGGTEYEMIRFVPLTAGKFSLQVGNENGTHILGSPFTFYVKPGPLSIAHSIVEWVNGNSFQAGSLASLKIILRDEYRNILNSTLSSHTTSRFDVAMYAMGRSQKYIQANFSATSGLGYELLEFVPYDTGKFKIWIGNNNVGISNSPLNFSVLSGIVSIVQCRGSWLNGISRFKAGDQATLHIFLYDAYGNMISSNTNTSYLKFSVRVEGRLGESIYISSISMLTGSNFDNVTLSFMVGLVGTFALQVESKGEEIQNSPFSFSVDPGEVSIHSCMGSWQDGINSSKPGEGLKLTILLRDAFGNLFVPATNDSSFLFFTPSAMNNQGQRTNILRFHIEFGKVPGYVVLVFVPTVTGKQWLDVGNHSEFLFNSPFPFFVDDGPLSLQDTYAKWKYGISIFPPYQGVKLYVYQRDSWGNSVGSLVNLQVLIYSGNDTEPSPYTDVWSQPAYGLGKGTQLITFTATASGIFSLYLEDLSGNKIGGCPYNFSVLSSYLVQENESVVYGSGLEPSIVGEISTFFVQLKDMYGENVNGYSRTVSAIINLGDDDEVKVIGRRVFNKTGLYKVSFILKRSGQHNILVLYCATLLNSSNPFKKLAYAGDVSIAATVVIATDGIVLHPLVILPHPVTVLLKDQYGNLVPGQEKLLSIRFTGHETRPPDFSTFHEVTTGNYTSTYQAYEISPIYISVYYKGDLLPGFPLYCYIHSYGWFPHAMNDIAWTWEDTATIIDVLSNDYFGLKPGTLVEVTKQPTNGVAYLRQQSIVYVPQRGFIGNDTFSYKVRDAYVDAVFVDYEHTDIALVTMFVVKHPPQIISTPKALEVCEEGSLLVKRGNKAFMIYYSKAPMPVAYAQVFAKYGQVKTLINSNISWEPSEVYTSLASLEDMQSSSNSSKMDLVGTSGVINSALGSLIYIGAPNFHGLDKITLSIKDEAGLGDEESIVMKVNHINSPPYIISYPFILVDAQTGDLLAGIDDFGKETYNTSVILVMDDDIDGEGDDVSKIEVSIQVEKGSLSMELPENSTTSTELRQEESYHWSPLPTAIIENKVFTVQAKGIKFRATLKECNKALSGMKYNGTVDGASFSIIVNDLGHQGMDSNCSSENSYPLSIEKQISLVFMKPMPPSTLYDYWKKVVVRTKVVIILAGVMALTFMAMIIGLILLIACKLKISLQKIKGYLHEESDMDTSRVYNPMWIPSAPSSPKFEFLNTPNPHHFQLQKRALREGLFDAHEEMKKLLGFQIKKHWASIKSFKSLSFKVKRQTREEEGKVLLSSMEFNKSQIV